MIANKHEDQTSPTVCLLLVRGAGAIVLLCPVRLSFRGKASLRPPPFCVSSDFLQRSTSSRGLCAALAPGPQIFRKTQTRHDGVFLDTHGTGSDRRNALRYFCLPGCGDDLVEVLSSCGGAAPFSLPHRMELVRPVFKGSGSSMLFQFLQFGGEIHLVERIREQCSQKMRFIPRRSAPIKSLFVGTERLGMNRGIRLLKAVMFDKKCFGGLCDFKEVDGVHAFTNSPRSSRIRRTLPKIPRHFMRERGAHQVFSRDGISVAQKKK